MGKHIIILSLLLSSFLMADAQRKPNKQLPDQLQGSSSEQPQTSLQIDTVAALRSLQQANPPMQVVDRQVAKDDYKQYSKPPESEVFGASFFTTASLSFEPNLRIATPVNYVLGPDDELLINVSGYQEANIKVQVQPEGVINIPQVGAVAVTGSTIEDATNRIRAKMAQTAYPNIRGGLTRVVVSLSRIRSIHVTLIGAAKPGNYTVSSLTTVFNSLYQSGGPGAINSYRSIQLIRGNRIVKTIDLYQFLTRGDQSGNLLLREGDVINFPVYKKRATILGEVKRQGVFELLENETLNDMLFFAGGFSQRAYRASVKVNQLTDTERQIKDVLKADFAAYKPSNGDEIRVNAILDKVENSVSIGGAVYRPGQFELTKGLTLKGLIQKADGLQEGVFLDKAILTRVRADKTLENISFSVLDIMNGRGDFELQKRDSVEIAFISDFKTVYNINIEGEVRKPGAIPFRENLTLRDALFLAGNFTDAGSPYNIEISRRITKENAVSVDTIAEVISVDTERELAVKGVQILLKPFDVITVRRSPGYIEQKRVTINGEVLYPGAYTIRSKNERISDLLKRAGGLTSSAYKEGLFLTRNSGPNLTDNPALKSKIVQETIRDTTLKVLQDVSRSNTRIAINVEKLMKTPGSLDDYVLEQNDVIDVLKLDPLVKMSGEVLMSTKTSFIAGKKMRYYIGKAGGVTDNSKKSNIYVLYPNGLIDQTHSGLFGLIRSYPEVKPGTEIIVPAKVNHKGLTTGEVVGLTSTIVSLASLIIVAISSLSK